MTNWGNATTVWSCAGMSGECGVVDMLNGPDGYMYMVDLEGQRGTTGEGKREEGGLLCASAAEEWLLSGRFSVDLFVVRRVAAASGGVG